MPPGFRKSHDSSSSYSETLTSAHLFLRTCVCTAEEEREAARKKFDENRRKHYNMREVLRANYDEDEKVEDVQDEGPKGVLHLPKAD